MLPQDKLEEVLNFAISKEQESIDFYSELAARSGHKPHMKTLFMQFANEERGHKKKLEGILDGKSVSFTSGKLLDLKIADYTVDPDKNDKFEDLDYQRALLLAMKREKAAFRLYSDLASATPDPSVETAFTELAKEEAKHKLRFEIEYDDGVLTEN
jgi:rubrerythrin